MVVVMNCCDEYGNCRQGRDCPVRIARSLQPSTSKRLLRRFFYGLFIAILGVLWLALLVACTYAYAN
jgi:hypothetical protein